MELKFTKTQQKILDVLADGKPHIRKELWACCPSVSGITDERQLNDFARKRTNFHLINIRTKLAEVGEDIVCQVLNRRFHYRWIKVKAAVSNGNGSNVPVGPISGF